MSANSWLGVDGLPQPPTATHQDAALDRQMIRHLLSRYGRDELSRMVQETHSAPPSDTASIVTSSASTVMSEPPPSVWDSASVRSFSDTSSITGSIISNVTSKTSKLLKGRTSSHAIHAATEQQQAEQEQSWSNLDTAAAADSQSSLLLGSDAAAASAAAAKKQGAFMCGFCKEEGMVKTCTRKNDLKRHIEDFHNVNAQWHCRQRGCQMVFDWQAAYKAHLKTSHGGSRMSLDEAKVNLCPQVVFACGFENCLQVYEAAGDSDAGATFKEYVAHVVKHFDEGSNSGDWTYSARMRNLLRQSTVNPMWTESVWNEAARNNLTWVPQSSGILRKRLECRHIGDVKMLVQYAYLLGSDPSRISKFREDFVTPIADTCQMNIQGHKIRARPPVPEPDPFQFRISRGANPALAQLLASQRRVYVPPRGSQRPAVPRAHQLHSPRSSSHLPVAPTSNPMHHAQPYFTSLPEPPPASPLFDPMSQPFGGPVPVATGAPMMTPHGAMIPDDLQSIRSLASSTPEPDIEMADTPMMTADFSSPYQTHNPHAHNPHTGMHTPPPTDALGSPALTHHGDPFAYHDEPHAF